MRIRNIGIKATYRNVALKSLHMIAGGTGITPLYQILQYICSSPEDKTEVSLLFLNRTEDDLLLTEELTLMEKTNPRVRVFYSVDRITGKHWSGFDGFLNKEKIEKTIPVMNSGLMCLSCGPPILSNLAESIWKELGVKNEAMFRF